MYQNRPYRVTMTRRTTGEQYTIERHIHGESETLPDDLSEMDHEFSQRVAQRAAVILIRQNPELALDVLEMVDIEPLRAKRGGPLRPHTDVWVEHNEDFLREVAAERRAQESEALRDELNGL